ncbi:MAG: hypothetical protein KGI06_03020 [Candidatus Micrarchaeota archaeon]|nr:hypothetical protein [Candidatus Micrarchaeota archaeon]
MKKEQVVINDKIAEFLEGKVKQGFKKSSYIRSLIEEAMKRDVGGA